MHMASRGRRKKKKKKKGDSDWPLMVQEDARTVAPHRDDVHQAPRGWRRDREPVVAACVGHMGAENCGQRRTTCLPD